MIWAIAIIWYLVGVASVLWCWSAKRDIEVGHLFLILTNAGWGPLVLLIYLDDLVDGKPLIRRRKP